MTTKLAIATLLATVLPLEAVCAQAVANAPVGGAEPKSVPVAPPADEKDTPEEIAADSARDLKDNRFYNRPGATRAQYDADWQDCRLIARGSRTPSGSVPFFYNPAVISPLAAGIGGGIGGLIAGKIAEGQQRRANRRSCLMIRGWRLVEVPAAEATRVAAMTEAGRDAYFNTIVGAETVNGKVTERTSFSLQPDTVFQLDAPVANPASLYLGKKADPAVPFTLGPGEAAVVITYRRPGALSAGRTAAVQFSRYDLAGRDLAYRPKDWKKKGDKTVYGVDAPSQNKKAQHEVQVLRVTPGDYVISSTAVNTKLMTSTNCFGAPTFHVGEGEVAYVGDFIPYWNATTADGGKVSTLAYASHPEDARRALATQQPALAAALKPVAMRNRATYACSAITMDRWDVPNAEALPDAAPVIASN